VFSMLETVHHSSRSRLTRDAARRKPNGPEVC
jgi:hypothetical protein